VLVEGGVSTYQTAADQGWSLYQGYEESVGVGEAAVWMPAVAPEVKLAVHQDNVLLTVTVVPLDAQTPDETYLHWSERKFEVQRRLRPVAVAIALDAIEDLRSRH
jgi:hypothetical protein